jgi:hypothetical protein
VKTRSFAAIGSRFPSRSALLALVFVAGLAVGAPAPAAATEVGSSRTFGLGLAVGTATSLVGKYYLDPGSALDFGVSFWHWNRGCWRDKRGVLYCDGYSGAYRHGGFGLHADYLWQDTIVRRKLKLDWHIGVGGRFWRWDDDYYYYDSNRHFALAARMPVGLDMTFTKPTFLELYVEAVPSLYVVPVADLDFEAFLGVRFYF